MAFSPRFNRPALWLLSALLGLAAAALFVTAGAGADAGTQPAQGTWIDFTDETSSRLILHSIPEDDSEEKDVATGDLDQNGWDDVVVVRKRPFSNPGPRADVLLMNTNGVLEDQTATYAPEFISHTTDARDVLIMDFDADGWKDVVVANTFAQQPKYYSNLGNDLAGGWQGLADQSDQRFPVIDVDPLQYCALAGGDVTGDGLPDIYFSNYDPFGLARDVLLINNGDGTFSDESQARLGSLRNSAFGTSVEIADVDNDGDLDIVKSSTLFSVPPWNDLGVFILFNDGSGNFSHWQKVPSDRPYMHTLGDLTNDGLLDQYIVDDGQDYVDIATAINPDVSVSYELRDVTSAHTAGFGGNAKMADLDGDGDLDAGVADVDVDIPPCESGGGSNRKFSMLQNEGLASGVLSDPWAGSSNPWNASTFDFAFLDINNDGGMDLFAARCSSYVVFINTQGSEPGVVMSLRYRYRLDNGVQGQGTYVLYDDNSFVDGVNGGTWSMNGERLELQHVGSNCEARSVGIGTPYRGLRVCTDGSGVSGRWGGQQLANLP